MRTQLPEKFAELTFVFIDDGGEMVESTERVLIKNADAHEVEYINRTGVTQYASTYTDLVCERKRVSAIKFLSNESDDYMDFVRTIQYADMTKAIEELGSYVEKEFKKIISVVPEDNQSLWNELKIHVLNM